MSVQNCVCEAQESISENLAKRLNEAYSHKEILAFGKIAYIDSYGYESDGIYEHFLYKNALDFVDLYSDFEKLELGKYCAMVLGMSIDEVELWRHREKLYEFLDKGGVVISFCHNYTGILPNNAGYIKSEVEIRDREVRLVGHALTDGVREYDINFRRGVKGFFNRGYFELGEHESECEVFLRDSEGKCVGYIDRISTNGVIVATAGADLLTFGVFENNSARRLGLNLLSWLGRELKARESNPSLIARATQRANTPRERGNPHATNCHTEALAEVSQNNQNRDISLPLNMTNTNASQSGRFHFDANTIKAQNPKNPLRKNPTLKNAIITGGASYERNFFYNKDAKYAHFFDKRIYHKDAQNTDFSEFDYIVIASRANPRFLLPCKEKFLEFLKNGGSIVSFGEVTQGYLPNIAWKEYGVNFWWWLSQGADMSFEVGEYGKGLFSKMELFAAKWHYHGAFYPPKDSQMILANELNEAIIYKDTSFKGGLYVTSLDPDFHLGQGFMPKTEGFFDTFMGWVEEDILRSRM
ncbi:hypothetical protein [Helicobacter sp. T3_23-1056]